MRTVRGKQCPDERCADDGPPDVHAAYEQYYSNREEPNTDTDAGRVDYMAERLSEADQERAEQEEAIGGNY